MTLTREQVLEMGAGREMDQLVSERVMKKVTFGDFPAHAYHTDHTPTSFKIFQPSTYIESAWEVLEQYPLVVCERVEVFEGHVTVNTTIYPSVDEEKAYIASASSAPLAICRAALLTTIGEET